MPRLGIYILLFFVQHFDRSLHDLCEHKFPENNIPLSKLTVFNTTILLNVDVNIAQARTLSFIGQIRVLS